MNISKLVDVASGLVIFLVALLLKSARRIYMFHIASGNVDHDPKFLKWEYWRYVMRCAIWYHLYDLKNVKSTHGGVLILVKLQARPLSYRNQSIDLQIKSMDWFLYDNGLACNFNKINTPPWVFCTFFKLYKWYQIVQHTTYYPCKIITIIISNVTCCKIML